MAGLGLGLSAYLPNLTGNPRIMEMAQQAQAAQVHWRETAKTKFLSAEDDYANSYNFPTNFEPMLKRAKELAGDGAAWAREYNPDFPTDFDFEAALERAKDLAADGAAWARENPEQAALCGAGVAVGLAAVAAPGAAVAGPVLGLLGFGGGGPIGGSLAAGIQSSAGNVVAPSLFATCQSAAMGGYGLTSIYAAVQAGGAAVMGAGAGGAAAGIIGEKGKGEREEKGRDDGEGADSKPFKARL